MTHHNGDPSWAMITFWILMNLALIGGSGVAMYCHKGWDWVQEAYTNEAEEAGVLNKGRSGIVMYCYKAEAGSAVPMGVAV